MKSYDFKKAKAFIDERKESITNASMGMHEDWFWTAERIFENGQYKKDLEDDECHIGGITNSYWATPTLEVLYNDGTDAMIPCFVSDGEEIPFGEKVAIKVTVTSGVLSKIVQEHITPLSEG